MTLEIKDVTYTVSRVLLDDVSLAFHPGEVTALSGPSGSGKTTLLSIAGGLLEPTAGAAALEGTPTWQGTGDPRPEFAFVLQVYGLVPILSARENVSVALRARGVPPVEADERADAALARFHIADLGDRQVEELSGGQMQRVACARAFVVGADVLLADEPTSELDEGNRALVLGELRAEATKGSIVVVATHDPAVVEAADRHYALDEGRLVLQEMVSARRAAGRNGAAQPATPAESTESTEPTEPAAGPSEPDVEPGVEPDVEPVATEPAEPAAPAVPRHRGEPEAEVDPHTFGTDEHDAGARSPFARPTDS